MRTATTAWTTGSWCVTRRRWQTRPCDPLSRGDRRRRHGSLDRPGIRRGPPARQQGRARGFRARLARHLGLWPSFGRSRRLPALTLSCGPSGERAARSGAQFWQSACPGGDRRGHAGCRNLAAPDPGRSERRVLLPLRCGQDHPGSHYKYSRTLRIEKVRESDIRVVESFLLRDVAYSQDLNTPRWSEVSGPVPSFDLSSYLRANEVALAFPSDLVDFRTFAIDSAGVWEVFEDGRIQLATRKELERQIPTLGENSRVVGIEETGGFSARTSTPHCVRLPRLGRGLVGGPADGARRPTALGRRRRPVRVAAPVHAQAASAMMAATLHDPTSRHSILDRRARPVRGPDLGAGTRGPRGFGRTERCRQDHAPARPSRRIQPESARASWHVGTRIGYLPQEAAEKFDGTVLDRALEAHRAVLDMRAELDALHQDLSGIAPEDPPSNRCSSAPASCSTISSCMTSTRSSPSAPRAVGARVLAPRPGSPDRGVLGRLADARHARGPSPHRPDAAVPRRADEPSRSAGHGVARGLSRGFPWWPRSRVTRPRVPRSGGGYRAGARPRGTDGISDVVHGLSRGA